MKETDLKGYVESTMFPEYRINFEKGRVINEKNMIMGTINPDTGYEQITIRGRIPFYVHRLIWMEANPEVIIEENEQIDHIDNNRANNKLSNLQKLTRSENLKKRDYSFLKDNYKNKHYVKATRIKHKKETDEIIIFGSLHQVAINLGINAGTVKHQCEKGKHNLKSPLTKKEYKFQYITKEEFEELKEEGVECYEKVKMTPEELEEKQAEYRERYKQKKKQKLKEKEKKKESSKSKDEEDEEKD